MKNESRPGRSAALLREARAERGFSVRVLAPRVFKRSGEPITGSFITDIEKGRSVPSDPVAISLAEALGMDVYSFLEACREDRSK